MRFAFCPASVTICWHEKSLANSPWLDGGRPVGRGSHPGPDSYRSLAFGRLTGKLCPDGRWIRGAYRKRAYQATAPLGSVFFCCCDGLTISAARPIFDTRTRHTNAFTFRAGKIDCLHPGSDGAPTARLCSPPRSPELARCPCHGVAGGAGVGGLAAGNLDLAAGY